MNAIPKAGGNRFSGSALANGSGPSLQGNNVTPDLNARGLQGASSKLKTLYDLNGAVGGPIKRDKVWFYATSRYFTNEYYLASKFYAVDPTTVVRTNDTSKQSGGGTYLRQQRPRDLRFRQAEDLRLVCLPARSTALADPAHRRVAGGRAHHDLANSSPPPMKFHGHQQLLFEAGGRGRQPDTIAPIRIRSACPSQGAGAAPHLDHGADGGRLFTGRPPASTSTIGFPVEFNASSSYVTGRTMPRSGWQCSAATLAR
jgi:hypothetical protein